LKVGQQVWLDTRNIKTNYQSRKIAPKREGPFKILEQLGKYTYKLQLPKQWRIHPVFDRWYLKPYVETLEHGENFIRPPPDILDGEEEYEVEAIINHKKKGKGHVYLVRWKGYSATDDSWEPEKNLENSLETLDAYKRQHNIA
jgi:hypothetical protein